jgi:hypothetical protein
MFTFICGVEGKWMNMNALKYHGIKLEFVNKFVNTNEKRRFSNTFLI